MKRIRIGKDISLRWEITTDGAAIPLEGRDLTVEIKSPFIVVRNIPFRVDGNTIIMTYYGTEHKTVGKYSVTLWENKGKPGQNVVDTVNAFELVRTSPEEDDFVNGDIQVETIDLSTANFSVLTEGGYRGINIDTLRTDTSQDSVEIKGETYNDEGFSVEIPKATTKNAGVMTSEDVKTLQQHGENISQIKSTLEEHEKGINANITTNRIADGAVTTDKLADSAMSQAMTNAINNEAQTRAKADEQLNTAIENVIANMQFSSSHIATSNEKAVFQNNHIKDVVISFKEDYVNTGYTFRIYQLGYYTQYGAFFFRGALYINNEYIKVGISQNKFELDTIPSNDENYSFDILYYDNSISKSTYKIGEISFTYLWSKIIEDPSPYFLNAPTDKWDAMHIEVSNFKRLEVDDSLNLTTTNSLSGRALNELPSNNKYFEYIFTSSADGSVVTNQGMYNSRMIVTSTSDSRLGVKVIDGSIQKIKKINIRLRARNVATVKYPGVIHYKKNGSFVSLGPIERFQTILVKSDAYTTVYFEDEEGVDSIFYLCSNPIDIEIVSLFIEFTQPIETFFIAENNEIKNQLGEIKSQLGEEIVVLGQNNIFNSSNQIKQANEYNAVNTPALFNGHLQYIKGCWGGTGSVCKFYIGFVDQNGYLIIKGDFDIEVPTKKEIITVDCSDLGIVIEKGDLLWVRYNAENSPVTPHYRTGEGTKSLSCNASTMKVTERADNVCLMYSYGIRGLSLEELKDKVIKNSNNINTLDREIEALKSIRPVFLKDRATKEIYELIVTNGQLGIATTTYSNAVVLGNSITSHKIVQDVWWGVWGMAATKRENDFVHVLKATLQTRVPDAECIGVNIANWELDFTVDKATLLDGVITSNTDLVVIRIGENVSYEHTATFESALRDLIAYIYTITPTTKIVITGQFWTNGDKETACINAAEYYNLTFVKINQFDTPVYKESVGNYVYGDDGQQHEITHAGVANHPSDIGMKAIANAISTALGY